MNRKRFTVSKQESVLWHQAESVQCAETIGDREVVICSDLPQAEEDAYWVRLADISGPPKDRWLVPKSWMEEAYECESCKKTNIKPAEQWIDGIILCQACTDEMAYKPVSAEEWAGYMFGLEEATQTYRDILSNSNDLPAKRLPFLIKRVAKDSFKEGGAENEKKHREAIKLIHDWFRRGCAEDWKKLDEYLKSCNLEEEC